MSELNNLKPFPGVVILEPYELRNNKKIGGFTLPQEDSDNAPQIGKIISIGVIPIEVQGKFTEWNMTAEDKDRASKIYAPFEVGMVVAYKKYQDFPIQIGTKKYHAVAFENLLFEVAENTKTNE